MGARGRYKLRKDVRAEAAKIAKAGKKRSLWASIGMAVGGIAATVLTGGLASPLMAAAMAGGASLIGGHVGSIAARQSKLGGSGRIRGGKFLQGSREGMIKQVNQKIASQSASAALFAGVTHGGLKELQKGVKTGDFSGMWTAKEGAGRAGQTGFKKAIDYRGSVMGKRAASKQLQQMGESAIGTTKSIAGGTGKHYLDVGPPAAPKGDMIPGARVRTPIATGDISKKVMEGKTSALQDLMTSRGGEYSSTYLGQDLSKVGMQDTVNVTAARKPPMPKIDVPLENTFSTGDAIGELGELGGRKGYDMYPLANKTSIRPEAQSFFKEDAAGLFSFDEASWAKGQDTLRSIDFQKSTETIERLGLPGSSNYKPWQKRLFGGG